MREILFRGKRSDNGEWVEGNCVYASVITRDEPSVENIIRRHWIITINGKCYGVDPKTVGQYTGLTDKNGKKIFEGDVLRIGGKSLPHWLDEGDIKAVEYNEGAFSPLCDYDSDCGMFVESSECEVIGSIYDNPELLEVSGDE